MLGITIEITRFVEDSNPGWVECKLIDAFGHEQVFVEKVPIVTTVRLDRESPYPQSGVIACTIIDRRRDDDGRKIVTVDTEEPWGVASVTDKHQFDVLSEQVIEFSFNADESV
jgi:hypothetical protein